MFGMKEIKAVVGTNAWGSKVYGKLLRGSYVDETVINTAVKRAMELGLYVFDTAQDYGMGKCQPMLGRLAGHEMLISAKYTPLKKYKKGSVIDSLENVLEEGILVGPTKNEKWTLLKAIFSRQRKKLSPLFEKMELIGEKYVWT